MNLKELTNEAAKLPSEERAALASTLLHGLDAPRYDVSDPEVFTRVQEAADNPRVMISFGELVAGLKRNAD